MKLFRLIQKINACNFTDFFMKLQYHKDLKLALFLLEKFCFEGFRPGPKMAQNEVFHVL